MAEVKNFIYQKKLLIFGSEGVGKTTLVTSLNENVFKEEEPSEYGK